MDHFYQDIQGWSDGIDQVYKHAVELVPKNSTRPYHFVEVGTWRGRSAAIMTVAIINSGKNIKFDCVDTWRGSQDEPEHLNDPSVIYDTLYEEFLKNMSKVEGHFNPIRLDSIQAAGLYEDQSLDFVFIDAQHDYESVKKDILAWMPKVRPGGIIAGHDYNHTGDYCVGKAVRELFSQFETPSYCWLVRL